MTEMFKGLRHTMEMRFYSNSEANEIIHFFCRR